MSEKQPVYDGKTAVDGPPLPGPFVSALRPWRAPCKLRAKGFKLVLFAIISLYFWLWSSDRFANAVLPGRVSPEVSFGPWPIDIDSIEAASKVKKGPRKRPPKLPLFLNGKPAERIFLQVPNNNSAIETSRHYAGKPHSAGSLNDFATAIDFLHLLQRELHIPTSSKEPIYDAGSNESQLSTRGISSLKHCRPYAWIDTYYPLLNTPLDRYLEILGEDGHLAWRANLEEVVEDSPEQDPNALKYVDEVPAFHGYSRKGDVQGKLIYVNYGRQEDFDALEEQGVDFNGSIVIARYGGIYRGLKVKGAQERGAVGCLIYSDPRDDGSVTRNNGYASYPYGPARNPTSIQRGSVQFLPIYPGDPTTPGYPSYQNSTRTAGESIPDIPSLPISWNNARVLLKEIEEGGQNRTVRLVNNIESKVAPIWNTMAVIPGHIKNEVVVVGNHRDAWVMGGSDPTSGTVSLIEVIRGLGVLLRKGWRPLRTIVIASWDAEEYGLVGSTEWGEDFSDWIDQNVVAYMNLDSSVAGSRFGTYASPSLAHLMRNAALDVPHPTSANATLWQARLDSGPLTGEVDEEAQRVWEEQWGIPLLESTEFDPAYASGPVAIEHSKMLVDAHSIGVGPLGSGSDYTVFLQHIGVASTSDGFRGTHSDPVYHYHSIFDTVTWQERYGDPGFHRHVAVAKHLGLMTLRLADTLVLPLNTTQYALELDSYLKKVVDIATARNLSVDFSALHFSIMNLQSASAELDTEKAAAEKELQKALSDFWKLYNLKKCPSGLAGRIVRKAKSLLGLGVYCDYSNGGVSSQDINIPKPVENTGASGMVRTRIRRFPALLKEQQEMQLRVDAIFEDAQKFSRSRHKKIGKKIERLIEAVRRVQDANRKLALFERGFISEDGIKDRKWYRHLGVAPGKWLGYGATTLPGITEALVYDKNVTFAQEEAMRLQILIDALTECVRPQQMT